MGILYGGMEISSCKNQEIESFSSATFRSCSHGYPISSLACIISTTISMIVLHIVFTGTLVDSGYKLSKECTRISLSGRKLAVAEGQPFSFDLKAYDVDCDNDGCKSYYGSVLVCDSNPVCKSCSIYMGPFSSNRIQLGIWLLSDIYTRAPGATCTISGKPTAPLVGSYPVSCVIKNNRASDVYQYLLRVVVLDESNPNDLGNQADLQSMIALGATIKVVAGVIDPQSSSMYWANKVSEYYAGDKLELTVALKDQFGNVVSEKTGRSDLDYPWNVTVVDLRTNKASYPSFDLVIDRNGYHNINFVANQVGPQSVFISNNGRTVGGYSLPFNVKTGMLYLPLCRGSWVDNKHTFIAGTTAQFKLKVVDKTNAPLGSTNLLYAVFNIFDESGKRNLGMNIQMHSEDEPGYVLIEFQTTKAGRYYVYIGNNTFYVPGSPFPYEVVVGSVSIPACKGVLMQDDNLKAGSAVVLNITLFDCCGNLVTRLSYVEFSVSISFFGNKITSPSIVKGLEQSIGYQTISFYPTLSGKYTMSVGFRRESILNSPFAFTILPGPFSVELSTVTGYTNFSNVLAGVPFRVNVQQRDVYGNAFTSDVMYNFHISSYELVDGKQNLVVPWVSTIYDAKSGVQSMNVVLYRAGNYYLGIGSLSGNISGSPFNIIVKAGDLNISACIGLWSEKSITAGSLAQFKVLLMDSFGNKVTLATGSQELINWSENVTWSSSFNKSIVDGNSTAGLSGIEFKVDSKVDKGVVNINFNITIAGEYNLHIVGFSSGRLVPLGGSPFYFKVNPDSILPATSSFTWLHNHLFTAGDKAVGTLLPMDRFNNSVFDSEKGTKAFQLKIFQVLQFDAANFLDTKITQTWKGSMVTVSFPTTVSGNFQLLITDLFGLSVNGSPFGFSVVPGNVVINNCIGQWQNGTAQVEEGSLAQFLVVERDAFNNVVCRNISNGEKQLIFQAKVIGLEEIHVLDLQFQPVKGESGTVCGQLLTFLVFYNLGRFHLEVKSSNQSILGSPYLFTVVEGPVNGSLSTFEGPGLEASNAGQPTYYVMKLCDNRGSPKGSHVSSLSVQIFIFGGTIQIKPVIVAVPNNLGVFNVSYLPTISGNYVILTRWIGVQLGETRYMTVHPGPISISNCSGKWENDLLNIQTGQITNFIITQHDLYGNEVFSNNSSDAASFTAKILKMGRSQTIYTSILSIDLWGERPTQNQKLRFQIWEIGSLLLQIQSNGMNINESPFPFTCTEGPVALPECSGEWEDGKPTFQVGNTARFIIYCTQDVSVTNLSFNPSKFQSTIWDESFRFLVNTSGLRIEKMVTETMGSQLLRFSLNKSGNFWLSVQNMVKNLTGSPFKFSYKEGPISMEHCIGEWKMGLNLFVVGTPAFFVIRQSDEYGNPVYEADPFTIKATKRNFGIPVTLLNVSVQALFTNRTQYRLVTFALKEAGDFSLYVGNTSLDILGSPFAFSYTVGLPVIDNTLIVGEGLSPLASVNFWNEIIVYIRDTYENVVPNSNASLSLSISGAENVQTEGFKPQKEGGFLAVYKPLITGQYNVSIFFNGLLVPKSPFHVSVGAGWVQAKFCTASIKPASTVIAGEKFRVYITARDLQRNSVSYLTQAMNFKVTPLPLGIASPQSANAQIYDYVMGVYYASFSIVVVGTFKVEIHSYGSYINGSAYTLTVIPGLQVPYLLSIVL